MTCKVSVFWRLCRMTKSCNAFDELQSARLKGACLLGGCQTPTRPNWQWEEWTVRRACINGKDSLPVPSMACRWCCLWHRSQPSVVSASCCAHSSVPIASQLAQTCNKSLLLYRRSILRRRTLQLASVNFTVWECRIGLCQRSRTWKSESDAVFLAAAESEVCYTGLSCVGGSSPAS